VLEVLYHHAKFGGARISPAAPEREFFCLFFYARLNRFQKIIFNLYFHLVKPIIMFVYYDIPQLTV